MSCCTKDHTKEKVKDDKTSCCDTAQTENVKSTYGEHSSEECKDGSCKIHHDDESEQKSDSEGCCD